MYAGRHTAFDTAHPLVPAVYATITIGLTMFAFQPVLIVISLAGGLLYECVYDGPRATVMSLRWQLPFILIVALVNPLFSASGSTELFRLGPRAVYLESLCYGCAMGGLFVASVLWFRGAAHLVPFDRVMTLLGNAAPTIALMISMSMRLIPRFVRQGKLVAAVQDVAAACAGHERSVSTGARDAVASRLRLSTVLMGWTMEDSLETADAMRARGWRADIRRTTYSRFRFTVLDALRIVVLVLAGCLCGAIAAAATGQYAFYPRMSELVLWWGYVPYAAWMLVPGVLHVREEARCQ